MRAHKLPLISILLSLGCSGPQPNVAPPGGPANAATNDDAAGDDAAAEDEAGASPAAFSRVDPPGFILDEDEGIELSGVIDYIDEAEPVGTLRLEIASVTEEGEATLLMVQDLGELGPWKVRVPQDIGPINIVAYFDADMNGPSPGEPACTTRDPIIVGREDVTCLYLDLTAQEPTPEDELSHEFVEAGDIPSAPNPCVAPAKDKKPAPAEEDPAPAEEDPTPAEEPATE